MVTIGSVSAAASSYAEIGIVVNPQQCILAIEKDSELIVVRQIGWIPDL